KDAAAFLKFALNPRDEVAFKRMVRLLPGIGARSAEKLWAGVEKAHLTGMHGIHEQLAGLKIPAKARKPWEQLLFTLEELAPEGTPRPPAEMLESVLEAVYGDYLRSKYPNYE